MDIDIYRRKYVSEPRYKEFVDFLAGVIRSGSFGNDDMAAAGHLAAEIAEAERVKIPAREHAYAEAADAADTTQQP